MPTRRTIHSGFPSGCRRRPSTREAYGERFADLLAFAYRHDLPVTRQLEDAMANNNTLSDTATTILGSYWATGLFAVLARDGSLFAIALRRMHRDLERGSTLAATLQRRMHRFLPAWYIAEVEAAEAQGCLAERLTILAGELEWRRSLTSDNLGPMAWLVCYASIVLLITSGFSVFIVPKFSKMFIEMTQPGSVEASRMKTQIGAIAWLFKHVMEAGILVTGVAFLWDLARDYLPPARRYRYTEWLWCHLPVIGLRWRRLQMVSALADLSIHLAAGETIGEAVQWSAGHAASPWLRRRLARYARNLHDGQDWVDAWEALNLPWGYAWVLRNARSRQNPASGFATMARLLADDLRADAGYAPFRWELIRVGVCMLLTLPAYYFVMGSIRALIESCIAM